MYKQCKYFVSNPSRNERRILIYSKFITVIFISWTQTLTSSIFFLIKCKWIKTKLYLFHILTLIWNFTYTLENLGPLKYMCIFKVYSTNSDDDRLTCTGVLYLLSFNRSGYICKMSILCYSCFVFRNPIKKMFLNFYLFDLVYAEGLNKNCIKLTQKKIMSEIWKQSKQLVILIWKHNIHF